MSHTQENKEIPFRVGKGSKVGVSWLRLKGDLNIIIFTYIAQTNLASSACKLVSVNY